MAAQPANAWIPRPPDSGLAGARAAGADGAGRTGPPHLLLLTTGRGYHPLEQKVGWRRRDRAARIPRRTPSRPRGGVVHPRTGRRGWSPQMTPSTRATKVQRLDVRLILPWAARITWLSLTGRLRLRCHPGLCQIAAWTNWPLHALARSGFPAAEGHPLVPRHRHPAFCNLARICTRFQGTPLESWLAPCGQRTHRPRPCPGSVSRAAPEGCTPALCNGDVTEPEAIPASCLTSPRQAGLLPAGRAEPGLLHPVPDRGLTDLSSGAG